MTRSLPPVGHHEHDEDDIVNRGLAFDLDTLFQRRRVLGLFAGLGAAALAGCAGSAPSTSTSTSTSTSSSTSASTSTGSGVCAEIPAETAGPFPGDGTNGPNVLTQSGIVRGDIRSSFGSATGVAAGVPLTINLTIVDTANGCAGYAGAAVYLWHCDRAGNYSLYSAGVTDQNYLRGVQAANNGGLVTFTSIFPAAYAGRWPHVHFEVYPTLAAATSAGNKIATSQLALPRAACDAVYATSGYSASVPNLARTSLTSDNVFGNDGGAHQLASMTGSVATGYTAHLTVPV